MRAGLRVFMLLACCPCAFALDPSLDINQYAHTAWKIREGFAKGTIKTITQTPDGYLWLGTEFGLYRFDGVRTVLWEPRGSDHLPSSLIRKLLVARDGTLWIGTDRGLASWKDGKLTRYPAVPAQRVDSLLEDREGTVWAGVETIPTWRLCAIQNGRVQCYGGKGGLGLGVGSLYEDRRGNLWAGTGTGLWRWKPGAPKLIPLSGPVSEIHDLIEDDDGELLISTRAGIMRLADGKVTPYPLSYNGPRFNPHWLLRDGNGGLWIGTVDRGLLHVHQGRTDWFSQTDGLSSDAIEDLFEDHEGNVWVGTNNGLDRFRNFPVTMIPVKQGLAYSYVESVLPSTDGSVWLGTRHGLDRWNDGRVTLYRKRNVPVLGTEREIVDSGLPDDFQGSLYEDHRGRIWVFSRTGAAYLEDGRFIPVRGMPGGYAHAIAGDSSGNLWVAQDQALFHLRRGGAIEQIPWASLGLQGLALALAADASQGGVWLGFSQGGVAYLKDGKIRKLYSAADGLSESRISSLQLDQDGTLWVATEAGLRRMKDGRVITLSSQNGLPCDSVHEVVEDNAHSVWLYMACGLVRITRPELDAWVADPERKVQATVFDNSDGLRSTALSGALSPRVGKSSDGRLWYVAEGSVFVIDPLRVDQRPFSFNKLPPPVHIEQVMADGKTYDAPSHLRLPALVRDVWIDYTALSFTAPEKVRFRYKLEGQDPDWKEVVNHRQAQYSNLPPRSYRFRVTASNNSGVWNEQGAVLDFTIAPAYYQTTWFRALCAAAVLALVWLLFRLRIRQVHQQERRFREVIETIPAMAFTARPDGSRTFVNRRWLDYTGLSVEQAAGHGWQAAVHPNDLSRVREKWRVSVATGEPLEYETRLCGAAGEYRWFLTRAVPLRDAQGDIRRWYGVTADIEDRKQAEEARAEIEEQWRAAFVSNPTMYFIVDGEGTIVTVNTFGAEKLGYGVAELLGRPVLDVVSESDREAVQKHAQECFEQPGRMMRWEARNIRKDGAMLWVRETANAVFLKKRPVLLVACEDITEQKRAEEAARRSEEELRDLIENVPAMVFIALPGPSNAFVSRGWREYTGLSAEETEGLGWQGVVHPEDLERHMQRWRVCSASGEPYEDETRFRRAADGEYRWFLVRAAPLRDETGHILKWYGVLTDIEERKRAEEGLQRSEAYLAEAQRLSHTGSFAYNPATRKSPYWSEELFQIFGLEPRCGVPDYEAGRRLVHPDDLDRVSKECLKAFSEKVEFSQEYRVLLHDGAVKQLHVIWHPVLDEDGELVEYVGTAADVTERKRAEEEREKLRQLEAELARMNRQIMLGELASSLAHEINQPIAATITSAHACLRWLTRDPPDLERARAATTRIEKDGIRAAEIIQRLREFCKTGAPPQPELVDINEVVGEMLVLLRDEASGHSISLRTELTPQLPQIVADRVQLQQVLMNLMLNGIEAMRDGAGELTIRSQRTDNGYLLISVSDTGVGLPGEKIDLIFNAFYTTKPQGTGMGLAISRSIIEAHGGRLWATANGERGATFHFTVPAEVHE